MNENFVIDWLKSYFDKPSLTEKKLKPILHFSLLWNLFEFTYFSDSKRLNTNRLIDLSEISCPHLSEDKLNSIFNYFKYRYLSNKQLNNNFDSLQLDKNSRDGIPSNYNFCQTILLSINPTKLDMTKASFLIIHRFRNNLFHGRKNPRSLNIYEQPFKKINIFLLHFIESTARNDAINKNRQIN